MSEIRTCTLVLEFIHNEPDEPLGFVWLFNGDGTSVLEQAAAFDTLPDWVKIVGPIDFEIAATIHGNLKRFFEQCGVSVIDESFAD
ncbi:MAG: hypothetical protein HOP33_23095 [Verrucomicrobia bacterium]|nr:hypothetical protein [Verrucomicrobiota bacterium]